MGIGVTVMLLLSISPTHVLTFMIRTIYFVNFVEQIIYAKKKRKKEMDYGNMITRNRKVNAIRLCD